MTHELKICKEYYEPLINGQKPFEIRYNDRNFKTGDTVILNEYLGKKYVPSCKYHKTYCEGWEAIEDIPEYGEDEAIDVCGRNRSHCGEYYVEKYSGRSCVILIKDIFPLDNARLTGYVAFTFEIISTKQRVAYTISEEVTE